MENDNFPLAALGAVQDVRRVLAEIEDAAMLRARQMGASSSDIARILGLTRQAVYHRFRVIEDRAQARARESQAEVDT